MGLNTHETVLFKINLGYYFYEYILMLFVFIVGSETVTKFVKVIRESYTSGIEFTFDWVEYPTIAFLK